MNVKQTFKLATAAGALIFSSLSFASAVNIGSNDVAIHGYDPVAYFTVNKAVEGSAKYTATHDGAIYRFSSKKNRDLFKADADRYAPQYGGYCAFGVSLNKKFDVDPQAFYIDDNKLYLNLNKDVQKKWLTDVDGYVHSANRKWSGIENLSVAEANEEDE
ncbi:YHS domain-containing (seleno)protein [Maricurvus nonylphenolicus]|uniref:YHS domain-containing (seleno)protein n=1 Tax=Maricurvus nonylphenolicus TaxID=1008307 RepID=UPI0036F1E09F